MISFMTMMKAVSDKNRVRIVAALQNSSMCVCQLTSLLKLAPSTTSKHISILQQAKLIESTRKGKWVFYTIIEEKKNPLVKEVLTLINKGTNGFEEIKADKKRLHEILNEYCEIHHEFHGKAGR
ncbi:MAG: metalloregulator ArsR/SmtB family transcription factor [Alphaproteobacteria bacterium]|nr:metalloregulator ArsR/SmtB family transcription factor [Alphaproteobacteria bacterium]